MNKGLEKVLEYDFEYLLQMNSDTLLAEEFFHVYDWQADYMGSREVTFVDTKSGKCKHFKYDEMTVIGAGRVFSKACLMDVSRQLSGSLWEGWRNMGLDNSSDFNMIKCGYQAEVYDMNPGIILDLKSDENIWKYDQMGGEEVVINWNKFPEYDPISSKRAIEANGQATAVAR